MARTITLASCRLAIGFIAAVCVAPDARAIWSVATVEQRTGTTAVAAASLRRTLT